MEKYDEALGLDVDDRGGGDGGDGWDDDSGGHRPAVKDADEDAASDGACGDLPPPPPSEAIVPMGPPAAPAPVLPLQTPVFVGGFEAERVLLCTKS